MYHLVDQKNDEEVEDRSLVDISLFSAIINDFKICLIVDITIMFEVRWVISYFVLVDIFIIFAVKVGYHN